VAGTDGGRDVDDVAGVSVRRGAKDCAAVRQLEVVAVESQTQRHEML
jgi:hypothetical protein